MLAFPAAFSIKVIGRNTLDFESVVLALIRQHAADLAADALRSRPSRDGHYLALTVTIQAHSREQLDAIYRDLSAHQPVLMVL